MHFKIEKEQLFNTVQSATKGISSRSTLPILSGLLLDIKKDGITAYATDLEMAIIQKLPLEVEEECETVIPARLFLDIIKNLPEGTINIVLNKKDNKLELSLGSSHFSINTLPAEDYPRFPQIENPSVFKLETKSLIKATTSIAGSASKDESRPILTGILVSLSRDGTELIATDSYRLATTKIELSDHLEKEREIIIPAKTLEVIASLSPKDKEIVISLSDNQATFAFGQTIIATKLIGGQFPDYRQLFPEKHEVEIILKKDELIDSLRRVSLMAYNNSPLQLKIRGDKIKILTKAAEVGDAQEEISGKKKGSDIEIAFNAKYLIEGVVGADEDEVIVLLSDPLQPGLITTKKNSYKYLIMPIRLT